MFLNYMLTNTKFPNNGLAPRYKELKFDKMADFYAKHINNSISNKLRQPDFDQQAVANDFQELHEVMTIARMSGNKAIADKVEQMANSQFDAMEAANPGMGSAYRNFFNSISRPDVEEAEETADTTPEGEK